MGVDISLRFPLASKAFSYVSPSFLWYFGIFARCEDILAEQVLWLLLAFAALATHVQPDREWSQRLDALAHLYLGIGFLCVSQGIRRAYGGWCSICLAITPPPPLLWLIGTRTIRTLGLALFTLLDLFLQSDHGKNIHDALFVIFLYVLRIYIQPKRPTEHTSSTFPTLRTLVASLLLSKQIDDAKRWMIR